MAGSHSAQPLHAQTGPDDEIVTLSLAHITAAVDEDTIVVPVELRNTLDPVGGLQLDLAYGTGGLVLAAARPTRRTVGWIVQLIPLPGEGSTRLLLFDPAGSNILPGVGPVMELVFEIPASPGLSVYAPLEVKAIIVSSQAGVELPAAGIDGSLTIGEVVVVKLGSVEADHGDTLSLAVSLVNRVPITGLAFNAAWPLDFLEILDVSATTRTAPFPVSWGAADGGAWVRLDVDEGQVLEPGEDPILELRMALATPLPAMDLEVTLEGVHLVSKEGASGGGDERLPAVSTVASGRVSVFPGLLEPPRELVGLSGQEAQVSLSWIPVPSVAGETVPLTGYTLYRSLVTPVPVNAETRIVTLPRKGTALGGPQPEFVDTSLVNGQTYHYVVTAHYAGRFESAPSNEISATPVRWMQLTVGHATVTAGDQGILAIMLSNDAPVAGVRFELWGLPDEALSVSSAVLGQRVPPDWVISLDHDTVRNVLSVVGLSPRLTTISPGDGVIISLVVDARDVTPVRVPLDVRNVVISRTSGRPYPSRATGGSVDVNVERVQLRVGTGVPIQPGETGSVALFMDNPHPVMAFQLVVRPASGGLQLLDVIGRTRLPADAQVDYIDLGNEAVRVIVSSFSNVPIAVGRGPGVSLVYRVDPDTPEGLIGLDLEEGAV
ncbi:MAG: fibronectin type III domain-containing protein, partial [Candidatus Marinimicrobia bacterium]|nr:fibronectin type III domain-containing protein [Candidatus Neomarinimicrobiota bacterium]